MGQTCLIEIGTNSILEAAYAEARRHRWIESQKSGRDLGDSAFLQWYDRYWWTFLRYRHIEHLLGEYQWLEFPATSFGALHAADACMLGREIIDLYRQGFENLDIINWALRLEHDIEGVFVWLLRINMNDARIHPSLK